MKFLAAVPFVETIIKSNGFAVFVMFSMMTAMAYTLWNQYNQTNDRLTLVEQQVLECYKANMEKTNAIIEKNTAVMEQVMNKLNK